MTGASIRQFFRELLGSRIAQHLEEQLLRLRQDFEERLQEQQRIIESLREEKAQLSAKVSIYELTLLPRSSRAGAEVVMAQKPPTKPNFAAYEYSPPVLSPWQLVQREHEEKLAKEEEEEAKAAKAPQGTA